MVLYQLFIILISLGNAFTLAYFLYISPLNTVSTDIQLYIVFKLVVTACLLLQMATIVACLYNKENYHLYTAQTGYIIVVCVAVSWIALCLFIDGPAHYFFLGLYMTSSVMAFVILHRVTWQRNALAVIKFIILVLTGCSVALLCVSANYFAVVEFASFICYNFGFMVLFLLHDMDEWERPSPNYVHPL